MPVASLLVLGFATGCGGEEGGGKGATSFEGQPWVLASGVAVPEDAAVAPPSATFEGGTVGRSTGCNRYTATYTVDGDSLEIGQIATTRMACPPPADAVEMAYVAALGDVSGWHSEDGALVLIGADGAELLSYVPATPVGSWQVTGLLRGDAFTSLLAGTKLTARFGDDGELSGSAGCNRYTGSYTSGKGAIEIPPPAATRKACAEPAGVMEQEAAYLTVLPSAVTYRVDGRSLELLSADGTRLVTYGPAQP